MAGLDELLGQDAARERLEGLVARGRLPHALLFVGPEGVGKSRAARAIAEILMCSRRDEGSAQACGACPACVKVQTGMHADVHPVTVEGARLKVDDVRAAMRTLHLRPMEGRAKLLILDGAERMTIEAQNALLKTLEEPTGTAYIILMTARPELLLPTVLSRCQRVPFLPMPRTTIERLLVEQRGLSEIEAALVSGLAQGSLGRALSIDPAEVRALRDRARAVDEKLFPGGAAPAFEALQVASDLADDRGELALILNALLLWLHDQVVIASGASHVSVANADVISELEGLVQGRGLRTVLERTRAVLYAQRRLELPNNLNPTMIAEQLCLALVGMVQVPENAEA